MEIKAKINHHLTSVRMLLLKRQKISAVKDVKKRETFCTVDVNVNWYSLFVKQ